MKNDTTFVRMRGGDHLGDTKCPKTAPRSVEFNFFIYHDRHKRFSQTERRIEGQIYKTLPQIFFNFCLGT